MWSGEPSKPKLIETPQKPTLWLPPQPGIRKRTSSRPKPNIETEATSSLSNANVWFVTEEDTWYETIEIHGRRTGSRSVKKIQAEV